jgi:hypothetical protein
MTKLERFFIGTLNMWNNFVVQRNLVLSIVRLKKMIRAIRQRHRLIWLVLAVVLPLVFAASIWFRHAEPVNESIPSRTTAETQSRRENK